MNISIENYEGKSKKTGNPFYCFKLNIGDWNTLVFPKTKFEYDYIKKIIDGVEE